MREKNAILGDSTKNEAQQAREIAINTEKLRLWRDAASPVVGLYKAGDKKGASEQFKKSLAYFTDTYDEGKIGELNKTLNDQRKAAADSAKELAGEYAQALGSLSELSGDTELSVAKLNEALAGLPAGTGQMKDVAALAADLRRQAANNDYNNAASPLLGDTAGQLGESRKRLAERGLSEIDLLKRNRDAAIDSLTTRQLQAGPDADYNQQISDLKQMASSWDEIIANAQKYADLDKEDARKTGVADYTRDVQNSVALAREFDPIQNQLLQLKQGWERDGLFTPDDIKTMLATAQWGLETEKISGMVQGTFDDLKTTLGDTFSNIRQNGISGFKGMVDGILGDLGRLADKVAGNWIDGELNGLLGGVMGSLGGKKGTPQQNAGAGAFFQSAISMFAGHASGLDRVPRDNYAALLHANEAVLSARDAAQWRATMRGAALAGGSGGGGSQGGDGGDIHIHYNIGTVKANDARSFHQSIQRQTQGLPRREQAYRLKRELGY